MRVKTKSPKRVRTKSTGGRRSLKWIEEVRCDSELVVEHKNIPSL